MTKQTNNIRKAQVALQRHIFGRATRRFVARAREALPRDGSASRNHARNLVAKLARRARKIEGRDDRDDGQPAIVRLRRRTWKFGDGVVKRASRQGRLAPCLLNLRGRMKKILFIIAVAVLGFVARQKSAEQNREKLIGTWMMEQTLPGGVLARGHITFKPGGDFYTTVDAAKGDRKAFAEAGGKWEMSGSTFKMSFTRKTIPGVDLDQLYGGTIVKVDDKTLTYKGRNGVETWKRVQ